jgi:hypothetical protein
MGSTRILLAMLAALALAAPGVASAATTTNAPPGNSGISQYLEVVPSASGNKVKGDGKTSPLNGKEQKKLQQSGSDGQALQRVVDQTSPDTPAATTPSTASKPKAKSHKTSTTKTSTSTTSDDTTTEREHDAQAVAAAYDSGSGGGGGSGIGVPLIALMGAAALAVGAIAVVRHRGGSTGDPEPEL